MRSVGELKTRIRIHEMKPNDGPEAGEDISEVVYECWAGVDTVWLRDHEQAKSNGTLEDLNLFIRDARGSFVPSNKNSISIIDPLYEGKLYSVKAVQPNLKDKRFIDIVAGLIT